MSLASHGMRYSSINRLSLTRLAIPSVYFTNTNTSYLMHPYEAYMVNGPTNGDIGALPLCSSVSTYGLQCIYSWDVD